MLLIELVINIFQRPDERKTNKTSTAAQKTTCNVETLGKTIKASRLGESRELQNQNRKLTCLTVSSL